MSNFVPFLFIFVHLFNLSNFVRFCLFLWFSFNFVCFYGFYSILSNFSIYPLCPMFVQSFNFVQFRVLSIVQYYNVSRDLVKVSILFLTKIFHYCFQMNLKLHNSWLPSCSNQKSSSRGIMKKNLLSIDGHIFVIFSLFFLSQISIHSVTGM